MAKLFHLFCYFFVLTLSATSTFCFAENDSELPLEQVYFNAMRAQTDESQLAHWLTVLKDRNWQQGYASVDFEQLTSSKALDELFSDLASRVKSVSASNIAYKLEIPDLVPESFAISNQGLFIGSLKQGKIFLVSAGNYQPVIDVGKSVYAIKYINNTLWVLSNNEQGNGSLDVYDGKSFKHLQNYQPDFKCELNDLTIDEKFVYITDSRNGQLIQLSADNLKLINQFQSNLLGGANGITQQAEKLFVSSGKGLIQIDKDFTSSLKINVGDQQTLAGIDGLYTYQSQLIGIQNAVGQARVLSISPPSDNTEQLWQIKVLDNAHPLMDVPTTGLVYGNQFYYVANSQLVTFSRKKPIKDSTYILKIQL